MSYFVHQSADVTTSIIGDNTNIWQYCVVFSRSKVYPSEFKQTILKKGCSIGANSTIVAGIAIGEYALIGAGSVVTKNIPANTVWYGNPAEQKGYITCDGILLDMLKRDRKGIIHSI